MLSNVLVGPVRRGPKNIPDLGQLEHPQLAFSVKQRMLRMVEEAIRATLKMESYLAPKGRTAQVTEGSTPPEPVAAVREQQDKQ